MKLLLLLWIVAEFVAFFLLAHWLGLLVAILLMILSMVVGASMIRVQGMEVMRIIQSKAMMGEALGAELTQQFAKLLAGIFLLVPGFLSSILGLLILLPVWRGQWVGFLLRHGFVNARSAPRQAANEPASGRVIDDADWKREE